MNAYKIEL